MNEYKEGDKEEIQKVQYPPFKLVNGSGHVKLHDLKSRGANNLVNPIIFVYRFRGMKIFIFVGMSISYHLMYWQTIC